MNVRRGLFRLWLVCSVIFVVVIVVLNQGRLKSEFLRAELDALDSVPIDCSQARGTKTLDYSIDQKISDRCWYDQSKFREHFPEYKDLSDAELLARFYKKIGIIRRRSPWSFLLEIFGFAIGVPIAVLIVGSAFVWAFAGFSRER